jgi:CRP/FNR family cyclic AMP-dependent transcriptional regulator
VSARIGVIYPQSRQGTEILLESLASIPPYDLLDEKGLRSLVEIGVRRSYRKNCVIVHEGEESSTMFVLLEGEMRVYLEDDSGKQLTIRILKSGDSFGEVAMIGDMPRTASVVTQTDCVVCAFPRGKYLAFLKSYPDILLSLSKALARLVSDTTEELGSLAFSDVYGRIVHIFGKYGLDEDGKKYVPRFTHRELSRMIGSSREIVSKILKELENGDYISVARDHYVIERDLPEAL